MIVAKFGGTSVSSAENIQTIVNIVKKEKKFGVVVVVSALSKVTDLLLETLASKSAAENSFLQIRAKHENLINNLWSDKNKATKIILFVDSKLKEVKTLLNAEEKGKKLSDKIVSFGEIMSSYVISNYLIESGIDSIQIISSDVIVTDENFGSAEFLEKETRANAQKYIVPLVKKGIVPVVTGFIGANKKKQTTTLGRGGSDYSASIIGLSIDAKEVQIWTDVNGIYTADPRIVENVYLIPSISYREASELASFGAKVLHPRTIKPIIHANMSLRVLNTFNPTAKGTLVQKAAKSNGPIRAISHKKNITLLNVYSIDMLAQKGFLARIYEAIARNNISVDLVSSSEVSESIIIENNHDLSKVVSELSKFAKVNVLKDLGMVSLIGENIISKTETIKEIFEVLHKKNILVHMVSLGAIDINVSLVIKSEEVENAVRALHENFFKQ